MKKQILLVQSSILIINLLTLKVNVSHPHWPIVLHHQAVTHSLDSAIAAAVAIAIRLSKGYHHIDRLASNSGA